MLTAATYLAGCSAAARFTNASGTTNSSPTENEKTPSTSGKALLTVEGIASFYSYGFDKKKTASGEIFNKDGYTAAHREFPFGTLLRVTNLGNGKSVDVTVNDRGPFNKERILDLSEGAGREIGILQEGTAKVRIEVLKWGQNAK